MRNEFLKFGQRERYWNGNPVEIGQRKPSMDNRG
jgi:hypothetical protein